MPIYEYRCCDCEQIFEEWLKSYDDNSRACPVCGGTADRIVSNTSFVLKGGGWYVTDYGNRSAADSHSGAADAAPAGGDNGSACASGSACSGTPGATGASGSSGGSATETPAKCASAAPSGGCAATAATGS